MANRITVIQLSLLILIGLLGMFKPDSSYRKASVAYQFNLPSHAAQPINDSEQVVILPTSVKAIVHAVHFNFAQEFLFVLGLLFSMLLLFVVYKFEEPLFTISYFDNIFCHLIAINAP